MGTPTGEGRQCRGGGWKEGVLRTEEPKTLLGWRWASGCLASKGYSVWLLTFIFSWKEHHSCDLLGVQGFWDLGHVWILGWEKGEEWSQPEQESKVTPLGG